MTSSRPSVKNVREEGSFRDDRIFHIGCDDCYAPKQYFDFFRMPRIKLVPVPAEDNLSHAKHVLNKLRDIDCEEDDERWMVLDTDHCIRDGHFKSYEQAISEARQMGIRIAISRPCFEVWLALHLSSPDEVAGLSNAEACCQHLSKVAGGYDKTHLKEGVFTVNNLPQAYHGARNLDATVRGGDKPESVTSRVYQLWHNILSKALASQLPDALKDLAEEIRAGGQSY